MGWVLAPHHNHSFDESSGIADLMWFEDHLKGAFRFPKTPQAEFDLDTGDGVPRLRVRPGSDAVLPIEAVDIYYSYERQPQVRFWADGHARKAGDFWEGRCPTFYSDEPLFAFANVTYRTHHKVSGAVETVVPQLTVTSTYCSATPEQLAAAGVKPTEKPQRLIEDFRRGFRDWWGSPAKDRGWHMSTRKVSDPRWTGPKGAALVCDAWSPAPGNWLGVETTRRFRGQNSGHFKYFAFVELDEAVWNPVKLEPSDFTNIYGEKLDDWHKIMTLSFGDGEAVAREKKRLLPRAGKQAVPAIPTEVSSWNSKYYRSGDDAYAKGNIEKRGQGQSRIRNLRWEGGEYVPRPKHWEKD
jgi:hypothetical protein